MYLWVFVITFFNYTQCSKAHLRFIVIMSKYQSIDWYSDIIIYAVIFVYIFSRFQNEVSENVDRIYSFLIYEHLTETFTGPFSICQSPEIELFTYVCYAPAKIFRSTTVGAFMSSRVFTTAAGGQVTVKGALVTQMNCCSIRCFSNRPSCGNVFLL